MEEDMTKAEFLETLRGKLTGEVSAAEIAHTLRYYDEYISEAVTAGKSETQVLEELGSPLLIAKTIIDTAGMQEGNPERKTFDEGQKTEERTDMRFHQVDMSSWAVRLVLALIVFAVLSLVFSILRILIPILLPLLVIWLIVTVIRNGGRR